MKKLTLFLMATCLLIVVPVIPLEADTESASISKSSTMDIESAETEELLLRIDEINEMDKSELISSEKRELRKEVRSINKELKQRQPGIYLSVGAAIVILLLLVLLL
jgi:hypothetical protein